MIDDQTGLLLLAEWERQMEGETGRVERFRANEKEAAKDAEEAKAGLEAAREKANSLRSSTGGLRTALSNLEGLLEELQPQLAAGDGEADESAEDIERQLRGVNRRLKAVGKEAARVKGEIAALENAGKMARDATRRREQAEGYVESLRRERWRGEYRSFLPLDYGRLQGEDLRRAEERAIGKTATGHGPDAAEYLRGFAEGYRGEVEKAGSGASPSMGVGYPVREVMRNNG